MYRHTINSFKLLTILCSVIALNSCNTTSTDEGPEPEPELNVEIRPVNAGTVQTAGDSLTAKSKPGHIFLYWLIFEDNGQYTSEVKQSFAVNQDSIQKIAAVYSNTSLNNALYLKAKKGTPYVYFLETFTVPVDSLPDKIYSTIYRANILQKTKEKLFTTTGRIYQYDLSHNGDYISFVRYQNGEPQVFIGNIETSEAMWVSPGQRTSWANHSNKVLISSSNGLCIYQVRSRRCYNLPGSPFSLSLSHPISWSPDDRHILVSGYTNAFYMYNVNEKSHKEISAAYPKSYFLWLDNDTFLTSGKRTELKVSSKVLEYSLDNMSSPDLLPIDINTARGRLALSPSEKKLLFVKDGLKTYLRSSNQTEVILTQSKWEPVFPKWILDDWIAFVNYSHNKPYVYSLTSGKVYPL